MGTVAQSKRAPRISRAGRPKATVVATIESNLDAVSRDQDEAKTLADLIEEERIATAHCRCANKRLHKIDCELQKLLLARADDAEKRIAENAKLSKLVVPDNEAGHRIVRAIDKIVQRVERETRPSAVA